MRTFEIFDSTKRARKACAVLTYDEKSGRAGISLDPNATALELPFLLGMFAEKGELKIGHDWTMRWIESRVPPPGRQNIGEILRANGLEEYDELALFVAGAGCSSNDDFQIREVSGSYAYAAVELQDETNGGETKPEEPDALAQLSTAIGRQLANARRDAGLAQAQLSQRTGITQAAISRIEHGGGNPTLDTLLTLAQSLGCGLSVRVEPGKGHSPDKGGL